MPTSITFLDSVSQRCISGKDGRVLKEDVINFIESGGLEQQAPVVSKECWNLRIWEFSTAAAINNLALHFFWNASCLTVCLFYRGVQNNSCLFENSRPSAARQLGQPMHSQSANFGKFKLNSHNLAGIILHILTPSVYFLWGNNSQCKQIPTATDAIRTANPGHANVAETETAARSAAADDGVRQGPIV